MVSKLLKIISVGVLSSLPFLVNAQKLSEKDSLFVEGLKDSSNWKSKVVYGGEVAPEYNSRIEKSKEDFHFLKGCESESDLSVYDSKKYLKKSKKTGALPFNIYLAENGFDADSSMPLKYLPKLTDSYKRILDNGNIQVITRVPGTEYYFSGVSSTEEGARSVARAWVKDLGGRDYDFEGIDSNKNNILGF